MNVKKFFIILFILILIGILSFFVYKYFTNNNHNLNNNNYSSSKLSSTNNTNTNNESTNNALNTPSNNTINNSTNTINLNNNNESTNPPQPKEEEISSFTTKIYTKDSERQNNISITCSSLNDTIVKKGETFSFCDTVGKATSNKGYQKADVFQDEIGRASCRERV